MKHGKGYPLFKKGKILMKNWLVLEMYVCTCVCFKGKPFKKKLLLAMVLRNIVLQYNVVH